jgi:hypothetical protein
MTDDDVLRSARNAYLVLIVALLAVGAYQFVVAGGVSTPIVALWVAGAGVFYASKYYYGRQDESEPSGADGGAAGSREPSGTDGGAAGASRPPSGVDGESAGADGGPSGVDDESAGSG